MALPFKIFILSLSAIILLKVVSASNDHDIDQIFRGSRGKRDDIGQIFYQSRGKRFITGPMIRLKLKNYRTPSSLDYIGLANNQDYNSRVPKKGRNGNMVEEEPERSSSFDLDLPSFYRQEQPWPRTTTPQRSHFAFEILRF